MIIKVGEIMENQTIFKGSFFGFSKKDVISYIDASNKTALEVEERLNSQINSLTTERLNLQSQISSFEEKIFQLEMQLSEQQETINKLTGNINELTETIERQQVIIEKQEEDLKAQVTKNSDLSKEAESLQEKGRKYDEIASRIGNVILEAEKNAKSIVDSAVSKSNDINTDTDITILEFSNALGMLKNDVQKLKKDLHDTMSTIEIKIDSLSTSIDTAKSRISRFSSEKTNTNISQQSITDKSSQLSSEDLTEFFR